MSQPKEYIKITVVRIAAPFLEPPQILLQRQPNMPKNKFIFEVASELQEEVINKWTDEQLGAAVRGVINKANQMKKDIEVADKN